MARERQYTMEAASEVAKLAARHIEKYLCLKPDTAWVSNVEEYPYYRTLDIDLLWYRRKKDSTQKISIEIKGDRYFRTGNYFFETLSNKQKNTPGCFLYSQANYLFYYFIGRELHIMPLQAARDWFQARMDEFPEKETATPIGRNGEYYNTVGRLVPRWRLRKEVPVRIVPFDKAWEG